jgi:hypothetical protein
VGHVQRQQLHVDTYPERARVVVVVRVCILGRARRIVVDPQVARVRLPQLPQEVVRQLLEGAVVLTVVAQQQQSLGHVGRESVGELGALVKVLDHYRPEV